MTWPPSSRCQRLLRDRGAGRLEMDRGGVTSRSAQDSRDFTCHSARVTSPLVSGLLLGFSLYYFLPAVAVGNRPRGVEQAGKGATIRDVSWPIHVTCAHTCVHCMEISLRLKFSKHCDQIGKQVVSITGRWQRDGRTPLGCSLLPQRVPWAADRSLPQTGGGTEPTSRLSLCHIVPEK